MKRSELSSSLYVVSPILFALSFILILFSDNMAEVSIRMLARPLIAAPVFALLCFLVSLRLQGDRIKASIFSSIFIVLFFAYSDLLTIPAKLHLIKNSEKIESNYFVLLLLLVFLIFIFRRLKRSENSLKKMSQFVLIVALISLVLPIASISEFENKRKSEPVAKSSLQLPVVSQDLDRSKLPDIYLIMLDEYSSAKVNKTDFGFEIGNFTKSLEGKDFYVAQDATSNYPKTFLSLASMLNMEYLDYLAVYKNSKDLSVADPLIRDSNILKFLKSQGYKYYQLGSWWPPTKYNPNADENINLYKANELGIDEFAYVVLESTVLRPYLEKFMPRVSIGGSEADYRKQLNYQFEQIPEVVKKPSPKFVFVHLLGPHDPYVYDQNCDPAKKKVKLKLTTEQNYANQVACINKKLEIAIDTILKNSTIPPVILLQSDEGAPFLRSKVKPVDNWKSATGPVLALKFPILSAYYLPGGSEGELYQSISSVNAFRVILNKYFGVNMQILPDRNYIIPDLKHLYEFKDVTEIVKNELAKKQL